MPSAQTTPHLTLPGSTFRALAPSSYLAHILSTTSPPTRPSSRQPHQASPLHLSNPHLTHCAGSSILRSADTSIVCGVQAEILPHASIPDPPRPRLVPPRNHTEKRRREQDDIGGLALLVPNVELRTGGSARFLPGEGPPGEIAQTLSARLHRLLISSGVVRLEDLRITRRRTVDGGGEEEETVGWWVLYITLLPLSFSSTEALFDALWGAMYAALRNVRLPKAWWDADRECVICSDDEAEARALRLRGRPVAATFGVFVPGEDLWHATAVGEEGGRGDRMEGEGEERRKWILADPDGFEEGVCQGFLTVVLDKRKVGARLLTVEKIGRGEVGFGEMKACVRVAEGRWEEWDHALTRAQETTSN